MVEESEDIKRFRFALGTNEKLPLRLGQHLILRYVVNYCVAQKFKSVLTCGKAENHPQYDKLYTNVCWTNQFGGNFYS